MNKNTWCGLRHPNTFLKSCAQIPCLPLPEPILQKRHGVEDPEKFNASLIAFVNVGDEENRAKFSKILLNQNHSHKSKWKYFYTLSLTICKHKT